MTEGILCRNKQAYASPALARQVRDRRQPHEHMRLYSYKCQSCDYWHVTKMKPPAKDIV